MDASDRFMNSKGGKGGKGKFKGRKFLTCPNARCSNWDYLANIHKVPFCGMCGTAWMPKGEQSQGQADAGKAAAGAGPMPPSQADFQVLREVVEKTGALASADPALASKANEVLAATATPEPPADRDDQPSAKPVNPSEERSRLQGLANSANARLQNKERDFQWYLAEVRTHEGKLAHAREQAEKLTEEVEELQNEYDGIIAQLNQLHEAGGSEDEIEGHVPKHVADDPELSQAFKDLQEQQKKFQEAVRSKQAAKLASAQAAPSTMEVDKDAEEADEDEEEEAVDDHGFITRKRARQSKPAAKQAAQQPEGGSQGDQRNAEGGKARLTAEERKERVDAALQRSRGELALAPKYPAPTESGGQGSWGSQGQSGNFRNNGADQGGDTNKWQTWQTQRWDEATWRPWQNHRKYSSRAGPYGKGWGKW